MVISLAKRSASRTISSKALRKISARSRGLRAAQPANAPYAASIAALASSTLALATEAILFSVAGSITSKRAPSEDLRHLPPIQRSVGTLASRLSYMGMIIAFHFLLCHGGLVPAIPIASAPLYRDHRVTRLRRGPVMTLTLQTSPHCLGDAVHRRQHGILQRVG